MLKVYKRVVTERTRYRDWRYKESIQYIVTWHDKMETPQKEMINTYIDTDNARVPYDLIFMSLEDNVTAIQTFIDRLSRKDSDNKLKNLLLKIIKDYI